MAYFLKSFWRKAFKPYEAKRDNMFDKIYTLQEYYGTLPNFVGTNMLKRTRTSSWTLMTQAEEWS